VRRARAGPAQVDLRTRISVPLMGGAVVTGVTTRTAFWPPKPKESLIATSTGLARRLRDDVESISGSWLSRLAVGGMTVLDRQTLNAASMAPAAPSAWPVTPFVDVTATWSPRTLRDRRRLRDVVERRRGAVGVDVVDVAGGRARRRRARPHGPFGAVALGVGGGDVVAVGGGAVARRGARGPSALGARRRRRTLEHEHPGRLGGDEAVPVDVERPGCRPGRRCGWTARPSGRSRRWTAA
jgi:hypothetical protein